MLKKIIIAVLFLVLGAGGVLGGLWYINEKPETLNISEAIAFSEGLVTHSADLATAQSEVSELSEDLATAQSEVSELSEDLATAQSEVSELSDQLETAQGEASTLSEQLETAQSDLNNELLFINDYYSLFGCLPNETLALNVLITDTVAPSENYREQEANISLKQWSIDGSNSLKTTILGCYRAIIDGEIQNNDTSEFDWYNTDLEYIFSPYGSGNAIYTALNLALSDYIGNQYNITFDDWYLIDGIAGFNLGKIHSYIEDYTQNLDTYNNEIDLNIVAHYYNDKIDKEINISFNILFSQTVYY